MYLTTKSSLSNLKADTSYNMKNKANIKSNNTDEQVTENEHLITQKENVIIVGNIKFFEQIKSVKYNHLWFSVPEKWREE